MNGPTLSQGRAPSLSIILLFLLCLELVEYLHNARELGWVIVELLEEGGLRGLVHHVCRVSMRLLSFLLRLKCLINRLVSVDDEGDDDVDEDEVRQLYKSDEVQNDGRVFLHIIDQLVHVHDLLPIVEPHEAKQSVQGHDVVIEVQVKPRLVYVVLILCDEPVDLIHLHLASEEFEADTRIY